ncbi:hypothetical protein LNN38_21235 [Pseudomonas sp. LA21]|uniref:hypothetical protein n=1 Tax=Pseudomonas sp. LA21 TaxID=2893373 RepID=UPI001FB5F91D|nr:hypothetical protein [Pseudomonas sp. LA21]MCJ1887398.1 hypothetical protein [Pseudomonas sp. LA21]
MTVQEMIAALIADGLSQKGIADLAGTTQPTVHRASKGAGVRYETGKEIERLFLERGLSQAPASEAPKALAMEGGK